MSVDRQAAALAAAHALTEAVGELLRYAREGAAFSVSATQPNRRIYRRPPFGDVDVPELLADACKTALEIESAEQSDFPRDDAIERNQMLGACSRFLDGWMP